MTRDYLDKICKGDGGKTPRLSGLHAPTRAAQPGHGLLQPRLRRRWRARVAQARRAIHALAGRASIKLLNSVIRPLRHPHQAPPKTHWAPLPASASQARRWCCSTATTPGARNRDTHHVGGVRREGRRPAQPCACVEGRPAPALNETPTSLPIG